MKMMPQLDIRNTTIEQFRTQLKNNFTLTEVTLTDKEYLDMRDELSPNLKRLGIVLEPQKWMRGRTVSPLLYLTLTKQNEKISMLFQKEFWRIAWVDNTMLVIHDASQLEHNAKKRNFYLHAAEIALLQGLGREVVKSAEYDNKFSRIPILILCITFLPVVMCAFIIHSAYTMLFRHASFHDAYVKLMRFYNRLSNNAIFSNYFELTTTQYPCNNLAEQGILLQDADLMGYMQQKYAYAVCQTYIASSTLLLTKNSYTRPYFNLCFAQLSNWQQRWLVCSTNLVQQLIMANAADNLLLVIKQVRDINARVDGLGRTLLHLAMENHSYACLLPLLRNGANPNLIDNTMLNPFDIGDFSILTALDDFINLLEYIPHATLIRRLNLHEAILQAATLGKEDMIFKLLEYVQYFTPNGLNVGDTYLHVFLRQGYLSAAAAMLAKYKDGLKDKNAAGQTPFDLYCATAEHDTHPMWKYLQDQYPREFILHGIRNNCFLKQFTSIAIALAYLKANYAIFIDLLDHDNLASYIVGHNQVEILKFSAEHEGLQVHINDKVGERTGYTLLHLAFANNSFECIPALLKLGASIDTYNEQQLTPLMLCNFQQVINSPEVMHLLSTVWVQHIIAKDLSKLLATFIHLKDPTSIDFPINQNGDTLLHLAVNNNAYKCAQLLAGAGCNPNQPNTYGVMPKDNVKLPSASKELLAAYTEYLKKVEAAKPWSERFLPVFRRQKEKPTALTHWMSLPIANAIEVREELYEPLLAMPVSTSEQPAAGGFSRRKSNRVTNSVNV